MPAAISKMDVTKIRQLRALKINYDRVRVLEYVDKDQRPPQTFAEF
jgi:hypothetical protein